MKIGVVFPQTEFSADLGGVRAFAEAAQDLGYEYLITADHVLGADPAGYPGWDRPYRHDTVIHEPMVLFAYLAGITPKLGFMPNVTGINSAMVADVPMPGSTPTMVPRKTPRKVYQRLMGCRQTENPLMMCVKVSIPPPRISY